MYDFVAYLQGNAATRTARFASEYEMAHAYKLPSKSSKLPGAIRKLRAKAYIYEQQQKQLRRAIGRMPDWQQPTSSARTP
jgi:hypothetical protein